MSTGAKQELTNFLLSIGGGIQVKMYPAEKIFISPYVGIKYSLAGNTFEDLELLSKIMAHDADMENLGTDAVKRWVGWEALKESIQKQFDSFEDSKISLKDQVIKVHNSGNVAWFSEVTEWSLVAQGQQVRIEGFRFTGVLEKRNSNRVIVQFHASVPVSGQAIHY